MNCIIIDLKLVLHTQTFKLLHYKIHKFFNIICSTINFLYVSFDIFELLTYLISYSIIKIYNIFVIFSLVLFFNKLYESHILS